MKHARTNKWISNMTRKFNLKTSVSDASNAPSSIRKHTIWQNESIVAEAWLDDYKDYLKSLNLGWRPESYDMITADNPEFIEWAYETNEMYLDDERENLKVHTKNPIICIATLGLWDGTTTGYRIIPKNLISECLYSNDCDYVRWYMDEAGDMRCDGSHHDGINHYLYRELKPQYAKDYHNNPETQKFLSAIYNDALEEGMIEKYTQSLYPYLHRVYGW